MRRFPSVRPPADPLFRRAAALALLVVLTCSLRPETGAAAPAGTSPASRPKPDVLEPNLDRSMSPGQDFFQYAVGTWLRRNPVPRTESSWGIGSLVNEELYQRLRAINEDAAQRVRDAADGLLRPKGPDLSPEQGQIGRFWIAAMDTRQANRLGARPLAAELDRIGDAGTHERIIEACFALHPLGVSPLFGCNVSQDEKQSDVMSVHLYQAGLGLPDRDFYFNPEEGVALIRREYEAHLGRLLRLLGRPRTEARAAARAVMAFETRLAGVSRKLEDLRDPERNYHKVNPDDFTRDHTPAFAWRNHLAKWGLRPETVIVGQPEFFSAMNRLVRETPAPVLQDYLRLQLVSTYAPHLDRDFDEEHFAFHGRVLSGQKAPRERWKRMLDAQDGALGMVLGQIFVREFFPAAAKARYSNLVEAVRTAYDERLATLEWMSPATRAQARRKLAGMTAKVGYPDRWKDYSTLAVTADSHAGNMMAAARWHFADMLAKFGKPVDRTEWVMTPQTYNAYYRPENNEIVLPAAIFAVPGFADHELDDAVVYGYAGASTIGHEITHGFDDSGRQFDAQGNLKDWWSPEDATNFVRRAEVMIRQFDAYEPLPGLRINGKATLGENIADLGGMVLGLEAFKKTAQYREGKPIAGLTPVQRYFLGYALGWMVHKTEARLRRDLLSDVHSPPKWRVLGPCANLPEFHQAFGVRAGQPMWRSPADQVRIW